MKVVGVLSVILLAMAVASADDDANFGARSDSGEATGASATPQAATNPANVVYRVIQAPAAVTRSTEQVLQPASRPVAFFSQPVFSRVVQQQPVVIQPAVQPVFTRTVFQPAVQPVVTRTVYQQPAVQPIVTRTVLQQPVVQQVAVKAEPEPYDANPSYSYGYEINAGESSVYSGHKETRKDGEVTGEYRVLDPNGDLRITRYTAGVNGYNAEVEIQKGAGPVYQHLTRKEIESPVVISKPAPQIISRPVVVSAPAPVPTNEDDSQEKRQSFVDANVVNLNRGGSFFQAAPVAAASAGGLQYAYVAVPQSQPVRFLSSGTQVLTNPYSYIRSLPLAAPAPVATTFAAPNQYSAPAPAATPFSSGTTFTRIVHSDGTTVQY